jgi:hypothetical protein
MNKIVNPRVMRAADDRAGAELHWGELNVLMIILVAASTNPCRKAHLTVARGETPASRDNNM